MNENIISISNPTKNYSVFVNKHPVTAEELKRFIENSKVKIVLLNAEYRNYSFEKDIDSVQMLRSKYPGQTYVFKPVKIKNDKKHSYFSVVNENDDFDGYAVVSKRELRDSEPHLLRASTEKIAEEAENAIIQMLDNYTAMLNNKVYDVHIQHLGTIIEKTEIALTMAQLEKNILDNLPFMDDDFDNELSSAFDKLK